MRFVLLRPIGLCLGLVDWLRLVLGLHSTRDHVLVPVRHQLTLRFQGVSALSGFELTSVVVADVRVLAARSANIRSQFFAFDERSASTAASAEVGQHWRRASIGLSGISPRCSEFRGLVLDFELIRLLSEGGFLGRYRSQVSGF